MRFSPLLLLGGLVMAFPFAAEATPLTITNGNFTTPTSPLGTYVTYPGGSTAITGWTVTGNSVDLISTTFWQAPPGGGQNVDLDGNAPGGLEQTLMATPAGQTATIDFELSGNPDGGPGTKTLMVSAGGTSTMYTYTVTASNSRANMMYVPESFSFIETGAPVVLSFTSDDPATSPFGPVIGDVAPAPVPEASPWSMMAASGVALLGIRLRKKYRSA